MKDRKKILLRSYLVALSLIVFAIAICIRLVYIQTHDREKYIRFAQTINFKDASIKAARGDLYSKDKVLLATSITKYDIYIDFKTINEYLFNSKVEALSDSLVKIFKKPKSEILKNLRKQRSKKNQYFPLIKNITYDTYRRISKFPIFNKGQNKGGIIVQSHMERVNAISDFGKRTVGFDNELGKAGLEGAYSEYLKGVDGKEIQQRINQKQWKPISIKLEPKDGDNVYSTIIMSIQNTVFTALESQLKKFKADHGCAAVMEVSTGRVLSLVNLQKSLDGTYKDLRNFAIWEAAEPGSTFKSVSMLALLDDGYVDPHTKVDIENGTWNYKNHMIRDDHGSGIITLSDVLSQSSNVGMSKMLTKFYSKNPKDFLNKLHQWHLDQKVGIDIPGESLPMIPKLGRNWSSISLAWLSFGYGLKLTPLQILTFYNGVANNGKLMKPQLLEKVEFKGKVIKEFQPIVLQEKMASKQAIADLRQMLIYAVEHGTSKSIYTPNLSMAGKTGTVQLEYWSKGKGKLYQASFCGFFPADKPRYTCIVVINKPQGGYYGSVVSSPVFKEIAGKILMSEPINLPTSIKKEKSKNIHIQIVKSAKINQNPSKKFVPNVVGMVGYQAISYLENHGLKVKYNGCGFVLEQSIEGLPIKKGMTIYLKLST